MSNLIRKFENVKIAALPQSSLRSKEISLLERKIYYIVVPEELVEELKAEGWKVKRLVDYVVIYVSVSAKEEVDGRPFTLNGHKMQRTLGFVHPGENDLVCDITLDGYRWDIGNMTGVKAYVTELDVRTKNAD